MRGKLSRKQKRINQMADDIAKAYRGKGHGQFHKGYYRKMKEYMDESPTTIRYN